MSANPLYAFNHAFNANTPIPTGSVSVDASHPSPIVSIASTLDGSAVPEASPSPEAVSNAAITSVTPVSLHLPL